MPRFRRSLHAWRTLWREVRAQTLQTAGAAAVAGAALTLAALHAGATAEPVPDAVLADTSDELDFIAARAHVGGASAGRRSATEFRETPRRGPVVVIGGPANRELAEEVARGLGVPLASASVTHFADGEISVRIDENVRGCDVYVVQSTFEPVNEHLMQLLLLVSALRRSSAQHITAVIPYMGYKRDVGRVPDTLDERSWRQLQAKIRSRADRVPTITGPRVAAGSASAGSGAPPTPAGDSEHSVEAVDAAAADDAGARHAWGWEAVVSAPDVGEDHLVASRSRRSLSSMESTGGSSSSSSPRYSPEAAFSSAILSSTATPASISSSSSSSSSSTSSSSSSSSSSLPPSSLGKTTSASSSASSLGTAPDDPDPLEDLVELSVPCSAADVALMLETLGVDSLIAVDLQAPGQGQIEGFFSPRVNVESLRGAIQGVDLIASRNLSNPVVVAPNESTIHLANDFRSGLERSTGKGAGLAVIVDDSRSQTGAAAATATTTSTSSTTTNRSSFSSSSPSSLTTTTSSSSSSPTTSSSSLSSSSSSSSSSSDGYTTLKLSLVGDVRGRDVVIVDDTIDTAGTLIKAVRLVKRKGARRVLAFATHGVFSDSAIRRINESDLEEVVVTNTIPLGGLRRDYRHQIEVAHSRKISQVSIAPVLAEAIFRSHWGKSLLNLRVFDRENYAELHRGDPGAAPARERELLSTEHPCSPTTPATAPTASTASVASVASAAPAASAAAAASTASASPDRA